MYKQPRVRCLRDVVYLHHTTCLWKKTPKERPGIRRESVVEDNLKGFRGRPRGGTVNREVQAGTRQETENK